MQTVSATQSKVVFSTSDLAAGAGAQAPTAAITAAVTGTVTVPTVAGAVNGVNAIKAVTGVLGVANGKVVIEDIATPVIKTITVDGYADASTIGVGAGKLTSALETLNLSNSALTAVPGTGALMTVADTAATLVLTVEKIGSVVVDPLTNAAVVTTAVVTLTAAPTTLNVKSVGNNYVNLTAAATETLNVSGTGTLNASTTDLAALKTVKVTETAGLTLNAAVNNTVTSVDTTGTTGTVTVSINGDLATYAGGAGIDNVTIANPGTIISKAIDLGAGNDRLDLSAATPLIPTVTLEGGLGDGTILLKGRDPAGLAAGA